MSQCRAHAGCARRIPIIEQHTVHVVLSNAYVIKLALPAASFVEHRPRGQGCERGFISPEARCSVEWSTSQKLAYAIDTSCSTVRTVANSDFSLRALLSANYCVVSPAEDTI